MTEWSVILLVGLTVAFIGLSKAGLGGGLGILGALLCVVAFGIAGQSPQFAIGFLLPQGLESGSPAPLHTEQGQWLISL